MATLMFRLHPDAEIDGADIIASQWNDIPEQEKAAVVSAMRQAAAKQRGDSPEIDCDDSGRAS